MFSTGCIKTESPVKKAEKERKRSEIKSKFSFDICGEVSDYVDRCENKEVVCYTYYRWGMEKAAGGISCIAKGKQWEQ